MSPALPLVTPRQAWLPPTVTPIATSNVTRCVEQLGNAIAELASRLHAATYELLVLLREFDERAGWNNGFLSCAHWLHWRTGIDLGAAREKVRVAKALAVLPNVSAAMARGELSFAKVRALTRVATPENERQLLDVALAGTAAHVERLVRAWRRVDGVEAARHTEYRHLQRSVATWVDDDGMVVIRGRLTPELGAVVQRALEAASDRLFRESAEAPAGRDVGDEVTPAQRRADALGLVAESALSAGLDRGSAGDRYQVVLHVDASAVAPAAGVTSAAAMAGVADRAETEAARALPADGGGQAVLEVGDGGAYVSAETSQRLACDAAAVVVRHDAHGAVLDVGRRTRTIPPAIRRALATRDARCQFPGCSASRCDAHHIEHWAEGGPTRLENLVLLCRRHHRAVHEGGYSVTRGFSGAAVFVRPDGSGIEAAPLAPAWTGGDNGSLGPTIAHLAAAGVHLGPATATRCWDGTPFDVAWAIDVLRGHRRSEAELASSTSSPV